MDVFNQSYQLRLKRELLLCRDNHYKYLKDEYLEVLSSIKATRIAWSNLGCFEVRHKQTDTVNLRPRVVKGRNFRIVLLK